MRIQDKIRGYKRIAPTPPEVAAVMSARREALDTATQSVTLNGPLPVAWRTGWAAAVEWLDRDRDGSVRVRITVTGPGLCRPYVRKLRLVRQESLNQDLKEG